MAPEIAEITLAIGPELRSTLFTRGIRTRNNTPATAMATALGGPEGLPGCCAMHLALRGLQDRVVLGPATDGGYYLIGMNRLHAALFDHIDWSMDRVLSQTLDAARAERLPIVLLERWAGRR